MKRGGPLRRSPMPRGKPLTRSAPMRLAPLERRRRPAAPSKRPSGRARPSEPFAGACEAQTPDCAGPVTQRHHRKLRRQGGSDEAANTLDVCSPCHDFIHANPQKSYTAGWLLHAWDTPATKG